MLGLKWGISQLTNRHNQTYFDLLELIHQQEEIIQKQGETIAELVNKTAEQENIIETLMQVHLR